MSGSRDDLLDGGLAAVAADDDASILGGPDHIAAYERMAGERPVPIPDGGFRRVAELIPRGPSLEIDESIGLRIEQPDRSRPPAGSRPTRERHDRDRRVPTLQLSPSRSSRHQLMTRRSEPCHVDSRGLQAGRRRAALAWFHPAGWTASLKPPSSNVETRKRDRTISTAHPQVPTAAPGTRRGLAIRAPLPQPRQAIAHLALVSSWPRTPRELQHGRSCPRGATTASALQIEAGSTKPVSASECAWCASERG